MKLKIRSLLVFFLAFSLAVSLIAKDLYYAVNVYNFRDPQGNPYVEIHTNIDAATVHFQRTAGGNFAACTNLTFFIQKVGDTGEASAIRVELKSPNLSDTSAASLAFFLNDVRKIPLEIGDYSLVGLIEDTFDPAKPEHKFEQNFQVKGGNPGDFGMSDLLFVENIEKSAEKKSFTRYGWDVVPLLTNDFYENREKLTFYLELYNTDNIPNGESYFINSFIIPANSNEKLDKYQRTVKKAPAKLDLYNHTFDISSLPTQTYYLNVDLFNAKNEKIFSVYKKFYVYNTRISVDVIAQQAQSDKFFDYTEQELDFFFRPMAYISTNTEQEFAKALTTYEEKKAYFFSFWEKRAVNPEDLPVKPWMEFKARLDYVNEHYPSTYLGGWQTDRGRVIITYGTPNDIERFPFESWQYPHEVWHFNQIQSQNNVIFVFYDPDGVTGDYSLLHSSLRGEVSNPRYKVELIRRTTNTSNPDYRDAQPGRNTGKDSYYIK